MRECGGKAALAALTVGHSSLDQALVALIAHLTSLLRILSIGAIAHTKLAIEDRLRCFRDLRYAVVTLREGQTVHGSLRKML